MGISRCGVAGVAASIVALVAACLAAGLVVGCGSPPPPETPAAAPKPITPRPPEDLSGFANAEFSVVRSDRFGVSFPLPDRASWTIADAAEHGAGWMIATHPKTSTVVRVRRFDETMLVGRGECEIRAQLVGELPRKEPGVERFTTLVDETVHRPPGWDARHWVAFEAKAGGGLAGHVYLIAGQRHSCLVVHVITEVRGDADADALADRLELFSSRTIAGVNADSAQEPGPLTPAPLKPGPIKP